MNRVFDYNGTIVAPSTPVKALTTTKKMLAVDSGDRDTTKYPLNNDYVVFLPRVYENVVNIRLVAAEFPSAAPSDFLTETTIPSTAVSYFMIDIDGLNKSDECARGANRSGYPDGYFAKIPTGSYYDPANPTNPTVSSIFYSDHTNQENIGHYTPPIGKLDRLHIRVRLHEHLATKNSMFWTNDGSKAGTPLEHSLTFQIETLDNTFDDFSSFSSRVMNREASSDR